MSSQAPPMNAPAAAESPLEPMIRKLGLWKQLGAAERAAILALPHKVEELSPGAYVVREGQATTSSCLLIAGFSYRQKVSRSGARSINAVHMPGDVVDLQNSLLGRADHSVQALTRATIARIPREAMIAAAIEHPNLGMAMWYDTLVDASIFREWILNIARRDAQTRIAHLLCEFGVRLESLGLSERSSYEFPMTQEQLADACGLTPVHVNRSLRDLEERGLITRTARYLCVADWSRLKQAGEFEVDYLHLDGIS